MNRRLLSFFLIGAILFAFTGCNAKKSDETFITKTSYMLNTIVTINIYDSTDESLLDGCLDLCRKYEELFSRTIDTSEIARLNRGEITEVSEDTAELIEKGLFYGELTDGAFDISVHPVSSLWDFSSGSENPSLPDPALLETALKKVDYQKIGLQNQTVSFAEDGMGIELGAIAKGYIADRIKEYLTEHGVKSATINLGGNMLCVGTKPSGALFRIGIQKPFADHSQVVGIVDIDDLSVVSSGIYERYITVDGKQYHHILNPSTGYPYDNGLVSVTIISPESADGDALSTSCFCLGLEDGMKLVESQPDCYGIFIMSDGTIHYSEGLEEQFQIETDLPVYASRTVSTLLPIPVSRASATVRAAMASTTTTALGTITGS